MTMDAPMRHTKFGILSCLTAFCVWLYFAVMLVLVFYTDGFSKWLADAFVPESRGISDFRGMGTAVVLFALIFFFIPVAGHLFGLMLGIIGAFRTSRKRTFAFAGIFLNLLPVVVLAVFYLISVATP